MIFISYIYNFLFYFQCVLLAIRTLHVLIRYGMFLYDMRQGGITNECEYCDNWFLKIVWLHQFLILHVFHFLISAVSWEKRGPVAYYIELSFEVVALIIDLLHHLHMLLWSNIFLSMASLVIVMQLRWGLLTFMRKVNLVTNIYLFYVSGIWQMKFKEK